MPGTSRNVEDHGSASAAYWGRRSRNQRRSVERTRRRAEEAGFTLEAPEVTKESGLPLYRRIMQVEKSSWKGQQGTGLTEEPMRSFYELMLPRLCENGSLRLHFARLGGQDVGYICGALFANTYRGLQFSYAEEYQDFALGNYMQALVIEELAQAGVELYDLGATSGHYKERWADREVPSSIFVCHR